VRDQSVRSRQILSVETNTAAPENRTHIPELDGLRGIAILMVMLGHFWLGARPTDTAEQALYNVLQNGWIGVDLFFVLSGFLITGILLDSKGKDHYFRNFYARRALRIFPLYYGFLFLWFWVAPAMIGLDPNGPFARGRESQLWFWTYMSNNLSVVKDAVVPHGLNHFWTLAIEEQFYLVWPAIVIFVSSRRLRTICILLIPLSLAFRLWLMTTPYGHTAGYVLTPARIATLGIGAWLASAMREPLLRNRIERQAPRVCVIAAAILLLLYLPDFRFDGFEPVMQTVGFPLLAIASAALLVLAMTARKRWSWYQRMFKSRVLRFFGKYSYGMYVLHLPVIVAFEGLSFTIAGIPLVGGSHVPAAIAFTLVGLSTTTLLALLSWHLYEKQFLKLKSRFRS
jgi:peptidoglycan/LPS O-acetylase OafA/YrhL